MYFNALLPAFESFLTNARARTILIERALNFRAFDQNNRHGIAKAHFTCIRVFASVFARY